MSGDIRTTRESLDFWLGVALSLIGAVVFGLTTKDGMHDFDYTARIAGALLQGHVGLAGHPGSWLNEFVPFEGKYYSVFPLGAVLSVLPVAILQKYGWVHSFPARYVGEFIAGLCVFFFFRLSIVETRSIARRMMLAFFPIFGTWTWCNLGFGGSWQLALGFALLGEVAALYFTLVQPAPLLAGASFAVAYGNRTELILTFPIFLYLWFATPDGIGALTWSNLWQRLRQKLPALMRLVIVPVILGFATAAYNFARFHSIFDFGYTRIPNVLNEPWYQHGLFSLHAIPRNMHSMLFMGWGQFFGDFPYIRPYGFGCSIFLASPFLFLLFREGGRYRIVAWLAIAVLTMMLWTHGNPGGWQFSYRYATTMLPWMFLLIAGNGPEKFSLIEFSLFVISVAINGAATWQFLWTNKITP